MSWKLDRDPFYGALARRFGSDFVEEAGFFEDTDDRDAPLDDTRLLCTPLGLAAANLEKSSKPPAVILSTGAFCPVHQGHLDLMEVARARVEAEGYSVIGGYLSPGHEEYLRLKLGDEATSSSARLVECGAAISGSSWLMVDPWEALYRRVAVNFTDVVARLEAYLHAHLSKDVSVFYAFGGDNARFTLTFAERGHAVVVGRPGHEDVYARYRAHDLNRMNCRILWTESARKASSTEIRETEKLSRAARVRRPTRLALRCEDPVVAPGSSGAWRDFQKGLSSLLGRWFEVVERSEQKDDTVFDFPVISLDPLTPGDHTIEISRLYDVGGYTQRGYAPRPGAASFASQVEKIPDGDYVLFDDDVCSGGTVDAVRSLLREGTRVVRVKAAVHAKTGNEWQEVVDSRDFLVGAAKAGLVLSLPDGKLARGIYVQPYVDPSARCSIPPERNLDFSIEVWRLNAKFYRQCPRRVLDIRAEQRSLLVRAGFGLDDSLSAVCDWHVRQLKALAQEN